MEQNYNDNRLSLLVYASDISKEFTNSLNTLLGKGKADVEVILLGKNNSNDSVLGDWVAKGKLKLIEPKGSLAAACAEGLEQASGSNCLVATNTDINLSALVAWFGTNKKHIQQQNLCIARLTTKGKTPLARKLFNFTFRLFTPLNLSDHSSGIFMARTAFAKQLLAEKISTANSFQGILYQAGMEQVKFSECPLSIEKDVPPPFFLSALTKAIGIKVSYFSKGSLAALKNHGQLNLTNGQHPVYRFVFFVLTLLAVFLMPYLSQDFGSTWDEKAHNDYSQLSYQWFSSFGSDTAALAEPTSNADYVRQAYRFYGEQMNTVAAFLYNWFDTGVYETRHFVNSIYGLLGLIFVALSCVELAGWRAGILGLLFMLCNPGWLGHSMNNPTDIPFASGFAVSIYYFIKILKALPKPKGSHLFWLAFGIAIAIGSRIGALLLIGYLGLFLGVNWFSKFREKGASPFKLIWPYAKIVLIVGVLGYFMGVFTWAYGLHNPFRNPFVALQKASENAFYTNNVELFEGRHMYMLTEAPWYYVIKFLIIGNPIYLWLGFVLGLLLSWVMRKNIPFAFTLMLLFMAVFPVAYAELQNLNYYNGWRHYLFVLPSIVILSVLGFEFFLAQKNKIISLATAIIFLVLFALPLSWVIKNHPNQYVYFNEMVGGTKGAYGQYETDYYSNSCREAAEWLARQHPDKKLKVCINNEVTTAAYWANKINPNIEFLWTRESEEQKQNWDYLILTSRTFSKNELLNVKSFPPKGTVYTVEADGVPLAAVVKRENNYMPNGYRYLDSAKFDTAIYFFRQAVAYQPADEEAHRMLGFSLMASGQLDEAETHLKKAIEIFPENYSAYSNMGLVYFNRKQFPKANEYFAQAVKYKENLTEAWYYSALAYLNLNDYNSAIKQLESATKHNGNTFEVYYYLGKSYEAVGNLSKATTALEMALSIDQSKAQAWLDLGNLYQKLNNANAYNYCMERYRALGGR